MKPTNPLLKILLILVALSNFAHAWYDTYQGRWISRDPIQEQGGINLYGFVSNDGINRSDYLGLKIANADCEQKREARNKMLEQIRVENDRDFSCESPCKTITVVINIPDPCLHINDDGGSGHAGLAIGNDFWDIGPGTGIGNPATPWWTGPHKHPGPDNLDKLIKGLTKSTPEHSTTLTVKLCLCEDKADAIRGYWDKVNQMVEDETLEFNFCGGLTCTSAVSGSISPLGQALGPQADQYLPSLATPLGLLNYMRQMKSNCGDENGNTGFITILGE